MLDRLSLSRRILTLGIGIVVCFTALLGWLYPQLRSSIYDSKRVALRQLVESATSSVAFHLEAAQRGEMSDEEAKASAEFTAILGGRTAAQFAGGDDAADRAVAAGCGGGDALSAFATRPLAVMLNGRPREGAGRSLHPGRRRRA